MHSDVSESASAPAAASVFAFARHSRESGNPVTFAVASLACNSNESGTPATFTFVFALKSATTTAKQSHWIPAFAGMTNRNNGNGNKSKGNISSTRNSTINRTARSSGIQSAAQATHAH